MDKIVVFETFYNPIEANIVKERLMNSGIPCFLSDEHSVVMNPLYNQALGGVKLRLFERDLDVARSILEEEHVPISLVQEGDGALYDAVKEEMKTDELCPSCGSDNVGYVQATKNRFGVVTMLFSLLLMVYPFNAKKVHHCFNCEHEF